MTDKAIKKKIELLLNSKPHRTPKFCKICGRYSSKKHQGVWCSGCPGVMMEYPDMTWLDCLRKSKKYGSGWENSFQFELYKIFKVPYLSKSKLMEKVINIKYDILKNVGYFRN